MKITIPGTSTPAIVTFVFRTPEEYTTLMNGPLVNEKWNALFHTVSKPGTYSADGRVVYARLHGISPAVYYRKYTTVQYHPELDTTYSGWAVVDTGNSVTFSVLDRNTRLYP